MCQILESQWKGLTCAVDLLHDEMAAAFEIDAPKDGAGFLTYSDKCRVPPLKRGEVFIKDNLRAHPVADVREGIGTADAMLFDGV
jgi:hypothetical protein